MHEEGWYVDPFELHEARWMSDGKPTSLVRDGDVESQDPPPDEGLPDQIERVAGTTSGDTGGEEYESDAFIETAFQSVNSGGGLYGPPNQ